MSETTNKVIRPNQFMAILGLKKTAFYNLKKQDPKFPKSFSLGVRLKGYLESDVNAYIKHLASKS